MSRFQVRQVLAPLRREVGHLIESVDPRNLNLGWPSRPFPAIDLREAPDRYVLTAEVPGSTAVEVDIHIREESLILSGERRGPRGVVHDAGRESRTGPEAGPETWSRTVSLPGPVNADATTAHLADGLLTVSLPKKAGTLPHRVPITPRRS